MKYGPQQHRALVALKAIRATERHAAEVEFVLSAQIEAQAAEQERRARAATDRAIHEWDAQLRRDFDPGLATALAQRVSERLHDAEIARQEADRAIDRRAEREEDWRRSDARSRQSETLLGASRRALARKREAAALDRQSDLAAQRWSRS